MRRKLLKSAYKVFARDGFEAARLEDIAKDAGHTRGALYAHFTSKEDLFLALLEQQIYQQLEKVQALVDAESTSEAKLRSLRASYVTKLGDPNWSMLMLEFKMFAVRHPRLRSRLASGHRAIKASNHLKGVGDLLNSRETDSKISRDGIRTILETVLQSLILQRAYDPGSLSSSDASEALGKIFDLLIEQKAK